jgi:hypothetical protein
LSGVSLVDLARHRPTDAGLGIVATWTMVLAMIARAIGHGVVLPSGLWR